MNDNNLEKYLMMVIDISKLYEGQGVLTDDLIGEGNLCVAQAMSEGKPFTDEEISASVMESMERLISDNVKEHDAEEKLADRVNKVSDKAAELFTEYGRKLTVDEMVEESGFSKKYIIEAIKLCGNKIEGIEYKEENDV